MTALNFLRLTPPNQSTIQHDQQTFPQVFKKHRKKKRKEDNMTDETLSIYDEIEIEDMTFDPNIQIYHYPCPCGDRFEIAIDDLRDGEEIAVCPSCSLMIRVIFDAVRLLYFLPLFLIGWVED